MSKKVLRNFGILISAVLFGLALYAIHHKLRQYHYQDIVSQILHTPISVLFLAAALTFLDYFVLTGYDALALRYIKFPLRYSKIAIASFVGYAFSINTTIIGGSAARYRIYSAMDVSAADVAKLVLFCGLTFWLGLFAIGGMVFSFQPQHIPQVLRLPFLSVRPIGIILLAVVIAYIVLSAFIKKPLKIKEWTFEMPTLTLSVGQIAISSLDWALAGAVLYVLMPGGTELSYTKFLGFFLLGQIGGIISSVPGGLGVFETIILLLLSDYVEPATLAGSLLLYRIIYYLLPLMIASALLGAHELLPRIKLIKQLTGIFGRFASAIIPYVFAFITFAAGAILLFSGAMPAVKSRVAQLRDILPLSAIEISHFLASIAGVALLILARGLQKRIDAAYHITVGLITGGIIFSLVKGLEYEESLILTIMLLALLPCKKEFYRKGSLLHERFTFAWVVSIIAVIGCSVWLGMFSYKHVNYSNRLWWQFAFEADAPRFLRATSACAVFVLFYFFARIVAVHRTVGITQGVDVSEKAEQIVRSSPKTYAWLALLGDKRFLFDDDYKTFIMYAIQGRSWIAMGDPVGPPENWQNIIWNFRELCDRYDGWPVFYQIEKTHLDVYVELGMTFLKLGEEASVNLRTFSLEGAVHKDLRHSRNKLEKENCVFSIIPAKEVPAMLGELKNVSDLWLEEKKTREKGFSLGFFNPDYLSKTPVAVVKRDSRIIAFANMLLGAEKDELSVDLMRFLPDSPEGIMDYLFAELLLWGKGEGYNWFNFGMAPFSGLENKPLAPFWAKTGVYIFRHGEHFYNFQGLRHYKEKFNPEWHPKYLACPKGLMLPRILANIASLISGSIKGIIMK